LFDQLAGRIQDECLPPAGLGWCPNYDVNRCSANIWSQYSQRYQPAYLPRTLKVLEPWNFPINPPTRHTPGRTGDKPAARQMLNEVVQVEPYNITAGSGWRMPGNIHENGSACWKPVCAITALRPVQITRWRRCARSTSRERKPSRTPAQVD